MFNFLKPNIEKLKAKGSIHGLLVALKHKDRSIRNASLHALGEIGDAHTIKLLVEALENRLYGPLAELIKAINEITDKIGAGPLLEAAQYGSLGGLKPFVLEAIEENKNDNSIKLLMHLFKSENWKTHKEVEEILKKIGDSTVLDYLFRGLKSDNVNLRFRSAYLIGEIGDTSATEHLIKAFSDEDNRVRAYALKSLEKIGDKAAVKHLIKALSDKANNVRDTAASSLGEIGDKTAVKHLIKALSDESPAVRYSSSISLGKIGDMAATEHLINLLNDQKDIVRRSAAEALGELRASTAIDPLLNALKKTQHEGVKIYRNDKLLRKRSINDENVFCICCINMALANIKGGEYEHISWPKHTDVDLYNLLSTLPFIYQKLYSLKEFDSCISRGIFLKSSSAKLILYAMKFESDAIVKEAAKKLLEDWGMPKDMKPPSSIYFGSDGTFRVWN